jgi:hypothetical protein
VRLPERLRRAQVLTEGQQRPGPRAMAISVRDFFIAGLPFPWPRLGGGSLIAALTADCLPRYRLFCSGLTNAPQHSSPRSPPPQAPPNLE